MRRPRTDEGERVRTGTEIPVEDYLRRYSPEVQRIIQELRRLVKSVAPKAVEKAYRGWPIRYSTEAATVCAVAGYATHANILLAKGATMRDPKKLLEGTGKSIRHVKVRSVEAAKDSSLRRLVDQAFR